MRAAAASLLASLALPLAAAGPVFAQQAEPGPALLLDLNGLQAHQGGCRLTFVVTNGLAGAVERAAFEMALFNKAGVVDRLTVLDFKDLPPGRTKVSRFDLKGVDCANVSRVLVNDTTECSGSGTGPDACLAALETRSTSGVAFGR